MLLALSKLPKAIQCALGPERFVSHSPTTNSGAFINHQFVFQKWVFEIPDSRVIPQHVPEDIERIFSEAAKCEAICAWDAAGAMYRKTIDAATRTLLGDPDDTNNPAPNWKTYRDLRLRLDWLFENGLLANRLLELSDCIREDGNDAAHDAAGVGADEVQDLGDFCERVLEELYTFPGKISENRRRRTERRSSTESS